jgi:hypothetical protein
MTIFGAVFFEFSSPPPQLDNRIVANSKSLLNIDVVLMVLICIILVANADWYFIGAID